MKMLKKWLTAEPELKVKAQIQELSFDKGYVEFPRELPETVLHPESTLHHAHLFFVTLKLNRVFVVDLSTNKLLGVLTRDALIVALKIW